MGTLLRNKETRRGLLCCVIAATVLTYLGFIESVVCGSYVLGSCVILAAVFFTITWRRYRAIAAMSDEIDCILHSRDTMELDKFSEGELAVLQSEVSKMTLRLRQQTDSLKRDKIFLADSLADISHQLKTPLTSLNLTVSMLSKPSIKEERREELLRDMAQSLGRIEWLVSSLLKLSRLDTGTVVFQRERVEAGELVRLAGKPLEVTMDLRDQQLVVDIPDGVTFNVDKSWMIEALGNLMKNCTEHTPPGGAIRVVARENALFTELTLSDTGEGFQKEDLPHLFERFYRGKNAAEQSVGIGLSLSRRIIVEQGGSLKAENGHSGGALFTIRFYKSTV